MFDLIAGLGSDERFVMLILGLTAVTGVTIALTAICATCWSRVERDRRAAELARDMLAAGFTAAEIRDTLAVAFPARGEEPARGELPDAVRAA